MNWYFVLCTTIGFVLVTFGLISVVCFILEKIGGLVLKWLGL